MVLPVFGSAERLTVNARRASNERTTGAIAWKRGHSWEHVKERMEEPVLATGLRQIVTAAAVLYLIAGGIYH